MNKTKRVLSVVLAVLMLSSLIAALAIAADDDVCNVVINYVFADSRPCRKFVDGENLKGRID